MAMVYSLLEVFRTGRQFESDRGQFYFNIFGWCIATFLPVLGHSFRRFESNPQDLDCRG